MRAWHPASLDDGLGKRRIRDRNPDGEQKSSAAMGRSFINFAATDPAASADASFRIGSKPIRWLAFVERPRLVHSRI